MSSRKPNFDPRQFDKAIRAAKEVVPSLQEDLNKAAKRARDSDQVHAAKMAMQGAKELKRQGREREYLTALEYVFRGLLQPWQKEAALLLMKQYQSGQEITFTLPDGRVYKDGAAN